MTFSQFSMTIYLLKFCICDISLKRLENVDLMLKFLLSAKKDINLVKFNDFLPILYVP